MSPQAFTAGAPFLRLGGVGSPGMMGKWVVQLSTPDGGAFSVVPRGRVCGGDTPAVPLDATSIPIAYTNETTGNPVGGGTAATGPGILSVKGDGLEVGLDITVTAGTLVVTPQPVNFG